MMKKASFIWLPADKYPQYQTCRRSSFWGEPNYAIAQFYKEYIFEKDIDTVTVRVFADTRYRLYACGELVGFGPSCYGGDYGDTGETDYPVRFSEYTFSVCGKNLRFFAEVQLSPMRGWDFSKGHGCLYIGGMVNFRDGTCVDIGTDVSWLCRRKTSAISECEFDFTATEDEYVFAEIYEPDTVLLPPVIKNLECIRISPISFRKSSENGVTKYHYEFDRIYSAHVCFSLEPHEKVTLRYTTHELCGKPNDNTSHTLTAEHSLEFCSFVLHSAGCIEFEPEGEASLSDVHLDFVRYPILAEGSFSCSDPFLTQLYDTIKHTLSICRQSIHLDSPTHKEPLGCTGDYAIEAMLTYYIFGDTELIRSDIVHTADILRLHDGNMFHTSYSLIFAEMLYDYYMFTADKGLLCEVADALDILIDRFRTYCGDDGIIHNPPDYMFLDWGYTDDGYSLHHPPKALGQTGLNCFWYAALTRAEKIYDVISRRESATECRKLHEKLFSNFDSCFFDAEKGLYVGGISDSSSEGCSKLLDGSVWKPKNSEKIYYLKQANILPVTYGLCSGERAKHVLEYAMGDLSFTDIQPYFMYYLLRAVDEAGLFDVYGLPLIHKYEVCLAETTKGLAEGWGEFIGDHSHAWGGAPALFLVKKALGFEMIKPGFEEYKTEPSDLGLSWVRVSMPSPGGYITN